MLCILFSPLPALRQPKARVDTVLPALFGIIYLFLYALDLLPRVNGHLFGELPELCALRWPGCGWG
jgi:hypothetical protein